MAETTKRTTNISASKNRKSRNDITRPILGMYLKEKNYSNREKFRKTDLALSESLENFSLSMMIDEATARPNSILFSNVLCLSNNPTIVDQQFSKFLKFVQGQTVPSIKSELLAILRPLICHIYIEMIKGRESRPATDFFRKYAYLIGPIENLTAPVVKSNSPEHNTEQEPHDIFVAPAPSATTQIVFQQDDPDENCDYFKELASSLSLCLRIDELECIDITRTFRSTKCDIILSLQALYAIKHFLANKGHVIILHILHTWFAFEIREALIDSEIDEDDLDDGDGERPSPIDGHEVVNDIDYGAEASNLPVMTRCDPMSNVYDGGGILANSTGSGGGNGGDVDNEIINDEMAEVSEEEESANEDVDIEDNDRIDEDTIGNDEMEDNEVHVERIDAPSTPIDETDGETDDEDGDAQSVDESSSSNDDEDDVDIDSLQSDSDSDSEGESDTTDDDDTCEQMELQPYDHVNSILKRIELESRIFNRIDGDEIEPVCNSNSIGVAINCLNSIDDDIENGIATASVAHTVQNKYLQNIRAAVLETQQIDRSIRVFNILNSDNRLCTGAIDPKDCHMACAFDDSTIRLWQLNHSRIFGRKPYAPFANRLCEWCLDNCATSSDEDDDDADDTFTKNTLFNRRTLFGTRSHNSTHLATTRKRHKREQKRKFQQQRCSDNIFTDYGGLPLRGHSKGVTDVLFSGYNPLMFSVSRDNTMRAWKASDYTCGAIYIGHNYPIWCVAESSTGLYLATGSRDLTARLWSTDREHPLQTYVGHTQDVDAIAFHPNGNYIATGSTDLTVRLWDVTSGQLLRIFIDCQSPVHCVSFSPDGKYLAAAGEELKVRIFDLAAGTQLTELKDHTTTINSIAWNSNSTKLASCCADGTVRVYSIVKIGTPPISEVLSEDTNSGSVSAPAFSTASIKPMTSNETVCQRAIKVFFNVNDSVTCIGNT